MFSSSPSSIKTPTPPPPWSPIPPRSPYSSITSSLSSPTLGKHDGRRIEPVDFKNKHVVQIHDEFKLARGGGLVRPQSQSALVLLGEDDDFEEMSSERGGYSGNACPRRGPDTARFSSHTLATISSLDESLLLWMDKLTVTPESTPPTTPTRPSFSSSTLTINPNPQSFAALSSDSLTPPPSSPTSTITGSDWEFVISDGPSVATQPKASHFAIIHPCPDIGPKLRKSKSGLATVWRKTKRSGKPSKKERMELEKERVREGKGKAKEDDLSTSK